MLVISQVDVVIVIHSLHSIDECSELKCGAVSSKVDLCRKRGLLPSKQ
jgi:hypothetical protein